MVPRSALIGVAQSTQSRSNELLDFDSSNEINHLSVFPNSWAIASLAENFPIIAGRLSIRPQSCPQTRQSLRDGMEKGRYTPRHPNRPRGPGVLAALTVEHHIAI